MPGYVEYSPPRLLCSMCDGSHPTCWARHWLNEWRDNSLSDGSLKMMLLKQKSNFLDLARLYSPNHEDQETFAIPPEDFVFACAFDRGPCDHTSFYSWPSDHYSRCYTFNSPNVENATTVTPWPKMITQAGPKNSLHLTLNIESGLSILTPEVGVRVIIHSPHLLPVPEEEGFNLGPGSSSISVSRTLFERLDDPHGTCNEDYDYKMPFMYSRKLCNELCLERAIRERCECRSGVSPAYNALGHNPDHQCDKTHPGDRALFTEICMAMVSRDHLGGYLNCQCHEACREMDFRSQVTSSKINPQYYSHLHQNRKAVPSLCSSDMEMINLEIYLESMSYEVISESPTYTWDLLLSNVGGFMGLFIGMSVVTILELLELAFDLLTVLFKPKTPSSSPPDEENDQATISLSKCNRRDKMLIKPPISILLSHHVPPVIPTFSGNPGIGTVSWINGEKDEEKNDPFVNSKILKLLLLEHHEMNKELSSLKMEQVALKQQCGGVCSEQKTRC
ncbi:hypothetical protein SK128_018663 [Halocaridina rubra]|uniref:Uncharacterized protein n=1 Tax=Halocaridina rubra TaxID=373956 RepID=A0AAN8WKV4_HALRR